MRLEIRDKAGKVRGVWVSKTVKGFNKKQLREQDKLRAVIDAECAAK